MEWEEYHRNPAIRIDGYWTTVPYGPPLMPEYYPTKGLIAVYEARIAAIGHVWYPEQQPTGSHYFLFNEDSRVTGEHHTNRIILSGAINNIDPVLSDKIVYLATDFRKKYTIYQRSLDKCVKEVLRLTSKRK
ncbi:MAG: hypothetical protein AABX31_02165 [Nanoarchaeota archaeon]